MSSRIKRQPHTPPESTAASKRRPSKWTIAVSIIFVILIAASAASVGDQILKKPSYVLSEKSFQTETTCQSTRGPKESNGYIKLPVSSYDGSCGYAFVHAISNSSYRITGFAFTGIFFGAALAPNSLDELAFFAATDVTAFNGEEFGFRLSLKDNVLYGYIQDGSPLRLQEEKFFESIRLMEGDGIEHTYTAEVFAFLNANVFIWLVDGRAVATYTYWSSTANFGQLSYYLVGTTHRYEGGWDASPLYLTFGSVQLFS